MPKILLVEDNPINQRVTLLLLEKLGCRVDLANDGAAAVELFRRNRYDLTFMDCQMPVLDGYEASGAIRALEREEQRRRTPIVALTAHALSGDRAKCLEAGMDDFLTKPTSKERLRAAISKWAAGSFVAPWEAAAPEPARAPGAPRLDTRALEQLFELGNPGEAALFVEVAQLFLATGLEQVSDIDQAARKGELGRIRRSAHTLRGGAAQLGITHLSSLCLSLEAAAQRVMVDQDAVDLGFERADHRVHFDHVGDFDAVGLEIDFDVAAPDVGAPGQNDLQRSAILQSHRLQRCKSVPRAGHQHLAVAHDQA